MIDPTLQEWLYAREVMRRLGFRAEDLFFVVSKSGQVKCADTGVITQHAGPILACVLRTQGKEFSWTIGPTALPYAEIEPAFIDACEQWNTGVSEAQHDDGFFESHSFAQRVGLIGALQAKGFKTP